MISLNDYINENEGGGMIFKNVKPGDVIYGIKLPHVKNPKATLVEGTIKSLKIDTSDENEYFGSSVIKFEVKGKECSINLWAHELNNSVISCDRSKFFLSKEARDSYYKEQTPEDIKSINKEYAWLEQVKKDSADKEERWKNKKFKSLQDELDYIDDFYDHEGSPEQNEKRDREWDAAIKAAKKKWANKQ